MYDLISEDPEEPGLPDEFHDFQPQLLRETCQSPTYPPSQLFCGTDLNLYYDVRNLQWYKRPDWFLVLGVEPAQAQRDLRLSYVIWQEAIAPFLVIELLFPGTEAEDLGQTLRPIDRPPTKWQVYERILQVPYYVLFDRYTNEFRLFQLLDHRYQELDIPQQRFWIEELELGLEIWPGAYQSTDGLWLRWFDRVGKWIPTNQERAVEQEQRAVEQEQRAVEQEQRANRLAAYLRSLGIDPEQV